MLQTEGETPREPPIWEATTGRQECQKSLLAPPPEPVVFEKRGLGIVGAVLTEGSSELRGGVLATGDSAKAQRPRRPGSAVGDGTGLDDGFPCRWLAIRGGATARNRSISTCTN